MVRRQPPIFAMVASSVVLSDCTRVDVTPSDLAAIQLAAATEIVSSIASNPGPITVVCVGYAGDWEPPALPSVGARPPARTGMDGCVERDGRLVSAAEGGQAISVRVGAPEPTGALRANVSVLTSTGAIDLAAYACIVRRREGAWSADECQLEAIS